MNRTDYENWVRTTCEFILQVGNEINVAPGAMQSTPHFDKEINIMFLGHDAHEGGEFPQNATVDSLSKRFYIGNGTPLEWRKRPEWKIWNNLYDYGFASTGDTSLMDDEEHLIFTNAVFFTGDKIREVNSMIGSNVVDKCFDCTTDLIFKVVKPKILVCFSISDVFWPIMNRVKDKRRIIMPSFKPGGIRHNVIIAECNGTKVIGMPHPSGAHGVLTSLGNIAQVIRIVFQTDDFEEIRKRCSEITKIEVNSSNSSKLSEIKLRIDAPDAISGIWENNTLYYELFVDRNSKGIFVKNDNRIVIDIVAHEEEIQIKLFTRKNSESSTKQLIDNLWNNKVEFNPIENDRSRHLCCCFTDDTPSDTIAGYITCLLDKIRHYRMK